MAHGPWIEALGWAATVTFVASYLCARAETLVRVQIAGALMWIAYGGLVRAAPVIAANALVVLAAVWSARRKRNAPTAGAAGASELPGAARPT